MLERESGFYVVRLSDSAGYNTIMEYIQCNTIMQYINGNGWHYPLPKPDAWIQEVGDRIRS